jgi:hypothetical protein
VVSHRDGGKLALETYGHLRNEHSVSGAAGQLQSKDDPIDNNVVNFSRPMMKKIKFSYRADNPGGRALDALFHKIKENGLLVQCRKK